jgi:signal transduction histidine kinase
MRSEKIFHDKAGSLISDYGSRISETVIRRRAQNAVRLARAEAELAIKSRSEFLANMNHELRTPLNAIIGFATMLRDTANYELSEDQQQTYAEYILQSADLLLGHINTLLEVAALDSGKVVLNDELVDCSDILLKAIERAKIRADAAKVKLIRHGKNEDVFAWGDEERIGQAVDHVMQAAIKACKEGGKVLVRTLVDDRGWAEIAVRDNGAGYTEEELDEALEAFRELHRGLDRSFAGPGVGYAVARTFIEMQGGQFIIKSRKGQGTLVRILMPPPDEKSATSRKGAEEAPDDGEALNMENTHDAA